MSNKWPPLCLLESAQVAYRSVVASFLASRRMLHECVLVLAKYPALLIAMQRQPRGAGAHGDAQSFESKQFTQCFGDLNFFQHLLHLLSLRAAFKLSSTQTTFASMVRGSLVKSSCDGKEIPRLLCHLAMEEFVEHRWCDDLSEYAASLRKFGCQAGLLVFGNSPAAGRMLLHLLDDFGDIFQVGLCIHQRSLRSTSRELSFRTYRQSHAALSRVGIIWTSGPKDAVWGPAMTRQLENYGTCLNDYYHIHHLNY